MAGCLNPNCVLNAWKNFLTNFGFLLVRIYVGISKSTIQWPRNRLGICAAVVIDVGIALASLK